MLISLDEIQKSLASRSWIYKDKKINKSYSFDKYLDGIKFVQNVAELAEQLNHHPDIKIGWCQVKISITSHDMGGVTTKCVNLAVGIDRIVDS